MRLWAVFAKSLREQARDRWVLALSILMGPLFVLIYWSVFTTESQDYSLLLLDEGRNPALAAQVLKTLDDEPGLTVIEARDRREAVKRLRDRDSDALLVLPRNLGSKLGGGGTPSVTMVGDLTNPRYVVCAVLANDGFLGFVRARTGATMPFEFKELALGGSEARSDFDLYIPGLLILSVVMLIFQAAMSVARELESGTYARLRLTPLRPFEFLGGMSLFQVLCGVLSVLLTFATAYACGFRSQGPLWVAMLVGAVTVVPVVGVGLMVAGVSRTVSQAFVIANFPLILLMFFTGAIYPMDKVMPVRLLGREVGLFDLLPPTHSVAALNKVLTLGAGLGDVAFELVALTVLSALYLLGGVAVYNRVRRQA